MMMIISNIVYKNRIILLNIKEEENIPQEEESKARRTNYTMYASSVIEAHKTNTFRHLISSQQGAGCSSLSQKDRAVSLER
tara:strand:+ start:1310 stop:1552 length:243 start_codon:yes stop_codon:yes gene_type:complete